MGSQCVGLAHAGAWRRCARTDARHRDEAGYAATPAHQDLLRRQRDPPWILAEVRSGSVPMMLEAASAIGRFDSSPWVGSVDVPTGVLVTSHDEIVGPHLQHHLAASIPHAEVRHVPVDHDGCVTRPREFNDAFVDLVEHALGP